MRINFPYPEIDPVDIPEKNLLGVFSPSVFKAEMSEEQVIEEAISHPIGSATLTRILTGREKVLVVVDDYTRSKIGRAHV